MKLLAGGLQNGLKELLGAGRSSLDLELLIGLLINPAH